MNSFKSQYKSFHWNYLGVIAINKMFSFAQKLRHPGHLTVPWKELVSKGLWDSAVHLDPEFPAYIPSAHKERLEKLAAPMRNVLLCR